MYKIVAKKPTTLRVNKQFVGETMEQKIRRILNNNEPIDEVAQRIYTERKDGVLPEYDIRTDRWEIATDGMDYITKSNLAKREERLKAMNENLEKKNKDLNSSDPKTDGNKSIGGPESTAGTDSK